MGALFFLFSLPLRAVDHASFLISLSFLKVLSAAPGIIAFLDAWSMLGRCRQPPILTAISSCLPLPALARPRPHFCFQPRAAPTSPLCQSSGAILSALSLLWLALNSKSQRTARANSAKTGNLGPALHPLLSLSLSLFFLSATPPSSLFCPCQYVDATS